MGLERKAQDANNNGYPLQAYGVVGQYEESQYGNMIAGSDEKGTAEYSWTYDLADLISSFTGETDIYVTIPAGSYVESCKVNVLSTISGGTNLDVGMSQPDGTVIDADGLVASDTGTTGFLVGAGALVGTTLANDAQVTIGGDRTAGVVRVTLVVNPNRS